MPTALIATGLTAAVALLLILFLCLVGQLSLLVAAVKLVAQSHAALIALSRENDAHSRAQGERVRDAITQHGETIARHTVELRQYLDARMDGVDAAVREHIARCEHVQAETAAKVAALAHVPGETAH